MNGYLERIKNEPEVVEAIQRKLQCMGLYQGRCDGLAGDALQEALAKFKAANRLDKSAASDEQAAGLLFRKAGRTFDEVLSDELAALRPGEAPASGSPVSAAHRAMLTGLAFSGGGVRSATFNLGILQALAQVKMLQRFDYLSTVSGGGYIGGWLSRWIAEHPQGAAGVERELAEESGSRAEPRQVKFLRQYSNFLTPKVGLFSADTWSLFATYLRNAFLNLLILSFGLAVLLILPRLWISAIANWHVVYTWVFMWTGIAAFLVAVFNIALGISLLPDPASKKALGQGWVIWTIVLPLMIAAGAGSVALWEHRGIVTAPWLQVRKDGFSLSALSAGLKKEFPYANEFELLMALLAPGLVYFIAWAAGWGTAQWRNRSRHAARRLAYAMPRRIWLQGLGHFLCAIGALAIGSALVIVFAAPLGQLGEGTWQAYLSHVASLGMPFLLTIFGITMVVMIGLIGRLYSDKTREWWSRQGGWTIILVLCWTALFLFSVYSPVLVVWSAERAPGWATSALAAGWVATAWASLWAARQPRSDKPRRAGVLKWLALCGPPLVAVATLTAVSTVIWLALAANRPPLDPNRFGAVLEAQMIDAVTTPWRALCLALMLCGAIFLVFAFQVDVNKFSLYMMYRNRLVRTYLGAANPQRSPHPFTGFDNNDDVPLHRLADKDGKVQRPYHIINAALNLVKGKELAWQTRKAANFAFTPRYCGYETPSMPVSAAAHAAADTGRGLYRATCDYGTDTPDAEETEQGVKLGMAMAVSGAAASSSMGFHSSASLTFLMTLFNVRLGRWCGNPCSRFGWKRASPPSGFYYLVKELLGFTDARSNFLYLSDGGHFENLGIYELVRRRCRLIVAVDASADGAYHFGDLGNAVRKCYTDFNIEIDLSVKAIERAAATGFSSAYCAAGKILYSKAEPGAPDGILLYIKPSLVGTEYVDIYNYHQTNEEFPHQGTVDQWFDETQFESYRALGSYIGKAVFSPVMADLDADLSSVEGMCEAIRKNWLPEERKRHQDRPGARSTNHIRSRTTRNPTMSLHSTAEKPLRSAERR